MEQGLSEFLGKGLWVCSCTQKSWGAVPDAQRPSPPLCSWLNLLECEGA